MEIFGNLLSALKSLGRFFQSLLEHILFFRKQKYVTRRALVDEWKRDLLAPEIYCGDRTAADRRDQFVICVTGFVGPEISYLRLVKRPSYPYFAEHLSPSAQQELKRWNGSHHMTIIRGVAEPPVRKIVASEIRRIERDWRLI